MKQKLWKAIEAYRTSGGRDEHWRNRDVLDILLDEALAQPQQEPVAWLFTNVQSGSIEASTDPDDKQGEREYWHKEPLYTSPPARKPLTDEEILNMAEWYGDFAWQEASAVGFCRAIEAKHGITGEQHG